MKTHDEIRTKLKAIFATKWTTRTGAKVPELTDIALEGNDSVEIEAAVLYADLTDSTGLVDGYKNWFAAEVYKAYLMSSCEVIKNNSGIITAFDGDRVMAVFFDGPKNSNAAKAALQISAVAKTVNAELKSQYPNTGYMMRQTIGIDTGKLLVARTGVWKHNDLVWVGAAANYAAKLCQGGSTTHPIRITGRVYKALNPASKLGGSPSRDMWEAVSLQAIGVQCYQTNWTWDF